MTELDPFQVAAAAVHDAEFAEVGTAIRGVA